MILIKRDTFEIGLNKINSPTRYWKPVFETSRRNFYTLDNAKNFDCVVVEPFYIATLFKVFFIKWAIYFEVKPESIGPKQNYMELGCRSERMEVEKWN